MSLLICPECGEQFSDKLECCPHCGFPTEEIPNYAAKESTITKSDENNSSTKDTKTTGSKVSSVFFLFLFVAACILGAYLLTFDKDEYRYKKKKEIASALGTKLMNSLNSLNGDYSVSEFKIIKDALQDNGVIDDGEISKTILKKMCKSGDYDKLKGLSNVISRANLDYLIEASDSYNKQPSSSHNAESLQGESNVDYSWIVGTWYVQTPFGTTSIRFEGDGRSGRVIELEDAMNPYSAEYGKYYVQDDRINYTFDGQRGINYCIDIHGKNRLYFGDGYYYKKAYR